MSDKKEQLELIAALSNACGASGFEDDVLATAKASYPDADSVEEDSIRNLYFNRIIPPHEKPVLMLDAHSDVVGFMIHSIHPNGTLRFILLGGIALNTLASSKVLVRTALGTYIPGIIAAKPPHFMSEEEKKSGLTSIDSYIIDVGAESYEDAVTNYHIRIGEPAVPDVSFEYDPVHDRMFGKAFDCRVGCAALLETMKRLKKEPLSIHVTGVLSSQEEVGERGASVAVHTVQPQIAICFEGCPADDTFTEPYAIQTALGKGPMLRFIDRQMITNPRFLRFAIDLAAEKQIPLQLSVREGGATNGAVIHRGPGSIPVIVIGIPVRYIHSQNGISSYQDFAHAVDLAVELAKTLTPDLIAGF